MTRDELYPIIDEVLHRRQYKYTNAGSAWIEFVRYHDPELRIHELTEALCDAIVERLAGGASVSGDFPFPRPTTEKQAQYLRDQYQASIAEFWWAYSRIHLPDTRHPSPNPNIVSDEKVQP